MALIPVTNEFVISNTFSPPSDHDILNAIGIANAGGGCIKLSWIGSDCLIRSVIVADGVEYKVVQKLVEIAAK